MRGLTQYSGRAPCIIPVMSKRAKLALIALTIALLCTRHAQAHHSFAGTYSSETVTLKGTVVEFLFRNPHSAILLEIPGEKNKAITWAAEWGTAGQLSRQGIEKDTLQPGDRITITGNPSRNAADHRLRIGRITRASDGWSWKSDY
jgi:uncharacterized protein DUF6152